jgi:flotillin
MMESQLFIQSLFSNVFVVVGLAVAGLIVLIVLAILSWYKKVPQGKAIVRTGSGGVKVSFNGMIIIPVLHRIEWMDISVKKVEIHRVGKDGLICRDNMRADIKVAFFVRVNPKAEDVVKVAQTLGVERASHESTLNQLFEAKFSEALKTVGKRFDFVELYDARERFRQEILNTIGTNLNGFVLDDAAIDYLEQTPVAFLQDDNILDSEGIKKIAELTALQHMAANKIRREEEKTLTQQNVEAKEAILELNRQLAEKEQVQKREIASITAREEAETKKIQQEERLRHETARITTEEELAIAEENKQRQIIVAEKAKERTNAVETERVEKDRQLEVNDRERVVTLAQIEKEKSVEQEKKNIQEVIRERVMVEKATVVEEEKIKDTRDFAQANREKQVAVTAAEKEAETVKISRVVSAQADKEAAEIESLKLVIEAEAALKATEHDSEATKKRAEAKAAEEASMGVAEAQVMEAKAAAREREGAAEAKVMEVKAIAREREGAAEAKVIELKAAASEVEGLKTANVIEQTAIAEAKGKTAHADAIQNQGLAEAKVIEEKLLAEAKGIESKADAMKKLDGVGKEHEEFKLRLNKDKEVELAQINIQSSIAEAQAMVLAEALKSAKIDIVGGEAVFFDKLIRSISQAKSIDGLVNNSKVLTDVKHNLLNGNGEDGQNVIEKIKGLIKQFGLTTADIQNLSVAAALAQMNAKATDTPTRNLIAHLLSTASNLGIVDMPIGHIAANI